MWKTHLPKQWWQLMELVLIGAKWLMMKLPQTWPSWPFQTQRDILIKDSKIVVLKSKLEKISKEKDDLDIIIDKLKHATQRFDKLIGSQITDKSKRDLGYVSYNVVPPPHTGRFSPLRIDLSHTSLSEFAEPSDKSYVVKPIKVVTKTSGVKISKPVKENNDAPLIEDCELEGKDKVESPTKIERKTIEPSIDKVEVDIPKQNDTLARRPVKYAEMLVPKAVLTRTGLKPVNSVKPANPKRSFQRRTTYNNRNFFQKVNTAKGKVNTARPNLAVLNVVRENKGKAIKASACWVQRPIKLDSALIVLKKHTYINARGRSKFVMAWVPKEKLMSLFHVQGHSHKQLKDQGYFNNGCSRHMTGNISYLIDFKEFDGGRSTTNMVEFDIGQEDDKI
uniref:Uncharacterized protein n=1 Tax=Tanacetum cinerariifolium TaxID=118510 RepID=A0A6L2MJ06_TANCI|nr:hypothetical protein [Tanacetum cinerariifolium]